MKIDKELLDSLTVQAKASPRLRMHYDLRNTPNDNSQRTLNALEPGMIMPIHRHRTTTETVVVLRGKAKWCFFNDYGNIIDSFVVEASGAICGVSIPAGQWHNTVCLESGTVIFESKDGSYMPLDDEDILKNSMVDF